MQLTAFLLCREVAVTEGRTSLLDLAEAGAFSSPGSTLRLVLYVEFFVERADVGQLVDIVVMHHAPGQKPRPFGAGGGTLVVPEVKDGAAPVWTLKYDLAFMPRWLGRHHFVLLVDGEEAARRAFDVHQG